ncbi:MAG TPA: insulinase family protein, partial [Candidatus Ozemobacteraceae bacterium]|nr:insulinase family protein [Candidatus Ozemobacteraceae bacterium]
WAVIVGDVKTDEALEIVKKTMGSAPKVAPPEDTIPAEPKQDGAREVVKYGDIQQAYVSIAWPAPSIESPDQYAMDLFSSIMGHGRSSRLHQALVEKERLATSISTSYFTAKDPHLLRIDVTCPQSNVRRLIDRVNKLLQEAAIAGVTQEELDKAKQMMIASTIFSKETAEAQAGHYGYYATLGKLDEADRYIARLREATLDDVKRVATQYPIERTRNVVRYEPQPASDSAKPQLFTLENGVRLILRENHSSPLVGVSVQIDAGGLREGKGQAGLANLTAKTLLKGTEKRSAEEIHQLLDRLGTRLNVLPGKSVVSLEMRTLTENFLPSVELLTEILTQPAFDESEIRIEQEKALENIKEEMDELFPRTLYLTLDKLFPDYPLAYSSLGLVDQLRKLKRSDVTGFHKKQYVGSGIVVAVVGDFFTAEVRDRLGGLLGTIPEGDLPELKEKDFPAISKPVDLTDKLNREQAQVMVAFRTFPKKDSRGPAMDIIEAILSGSMSSRLFTQLRDKESLAYSVSGNALGSRATGYFYATMSTKAAQADHARTRLIEELDTFGKKGFTEEEFADAKNYILGQHALSLVGNLEQASTFSYDEYMGLGFDYFEKYPALIRQTTKDEVLKLAGEFFLGTHGYITGTTRP